MGDRTMNTTKQHTQGELFYDSNTESLGYSGGWIARMGQKRQGDDPHGDQDADGERLAACWNACVGVSTETLLRVGELAKALAQMDAGCKKAFDKIQIEHGQLQQRYGKSLEAIGLLLEIVTDAEQLMIIAVANDDGLDGGDAQGFLKDAAVVKEVARGVIDESRTEEISDQPPA
jgi:hypothetical protein